jgi:hypothetical protein
VGRSGPKHRRVALKEFDDGSLREEAVRVVPLILEPWRLKKPVWSKEGE